MCIRDSTYIASIIQKCITKKSKGKLTTSDKIDRIVTNRWLALPIFALVMIIVYYVSVTTVGTIFTDWANDGAVSYTHLLEAALRLKDQYGAHVTVITMGPPQADAALREALAMGADEAILVTDRAFGGADTLATSTTICLLYTSRCV